MKKLLILTLILLFALAVCSCGDGAQDCVSQNGSQSTSDSVIEDSDETTDNDADASTDTDTSADTVVSDDTDTGNDVNSGNDGNDKETDISDVNSNGDDINDSGNNGENGTSDDLWTGNKQ